LSKSSTLPPPLSAKDLTGGRTQILNVRLTRKINRHQVETDEDSAPEIISETADWLHWNEHLDNPYDSEDDCMADVEFDMDQDNSSKDPESPERQDVSAAPNVHRLIRPIQKSKRQAEQVLVTVNEMETSRNNGVKKKYDRMR
jgi:hypothetical protein